MKKLLAIFLFSLGCNAFADRDYFTVTNAGGGQFDTDPIIYLSAGGVIFDTLYGNKSYLITGADYPCYTEQRDLCIINVTEYKMRASVPDFIGTLYVDPSSHLIIKMKKNPLSGFDITGYQDLIIKRK